jgi:serpin B
MTTGQAISDVARVAAEPTEAASEAVTVFTADLYREIADDARGENVVCSPYSVAVALGMTVQGARGATAREMLDVLHGDDAAGVASGLNGIDAALSRRPGEVRVLGEPGRVDLAAANALWIQAGVTWRRELLDVLAREFGAGLRTVDYRNEPEAARQAINAWVSQRTRERIPELVPPGTVGDLTRLTLVNALWFKAPWQTPFEQHHTRPRPFHRLDGSRVEVDLMRELVYAAACVEGEGWQAVVLPYAGGELAMTVIVPDAGRFADVERSVGAWLPQVLGRHTPEPVDVGLPRWTSRTGTELTAALKRLGMPTAFSDTADFTGFGDFTSDEPLQIGAVVHEGFVAVDEAGTEAAAATAVVMRAAGAMLSPRTLVADRPFLYVIHDQPTRTPLFLGRVLDPTRTA